MEHLFILFIGILIAQLLYIAGVGLQYRTKDYFYYFIYIFFIANYFFIYFPDPFFPSTGLSDIIRAIALRPTAFVVYFFYFHFIDYFLQFKTIYPLLHKRLRFTKILTLLFAIAFLLFECFYSFSQLQPYYLACSIILFIVLCFRIVELYRIKETIARYIFKGCVLLATGAFVSNLLVLIFHALHIVFVDPYTMIPVQLGVIGEFFFFNAALTFKSRKTAQDLIATQQQLIEQLNTKEKILLEKQNLQNKIARDLHDEIGSTLSGVGLITQIAQDRLQKNKFPEAFAIMDTIRNNSSEMGKKLNDIIWIVQPQNDSLQDLIEKISGTYTPLCHGQNINCLFRFDETLNTILLNVLQRSNIYLICKEAINNCLKYANATNIFTSITKKEDVISIIIKDDGKGFDPLQQTSGNGLKNIIARSKEIGASVQIKSVPGKGTQISLEIPITNL